MPDAPMQQASGNEPLSAEDAVFYYLDTKDMPLHIGCVLVFDGPIPLEDCIELVRSKLPLIPRYRQRVIEPPFNVGHPMWEWDCAFDLRNHIHGRHLKRGTEAELQTLTGQILSKAMDRTRPLWDMTVVSGLNAGRTAIVMRAHHCLVDGVAGVALLNVLFNPSTQAIEPHKLEARPPVDPAISLVEGILTSYSELIDRFTSVQSAALNIVGAVAERGVAALEELLRFTPELLGSVDRLPFNKPCLGARKLVWTEVSIKDVNAIRETLGGKLNDVVLAVVAAAIRRYARLHGQAVKGRMLRIMVPVNIRPRDGIQNGPRSHTGNRISMLPLVIPLDIAKPVKLLNAVRERMDLLKQSAVSEVIRMVGNWIGFVPAPVQAMIGPYASSSPVLPIPPWNMVCTNVPGPPEAIHAFGRRMLASYPYVPIGAEMGLNIAIQSYDGKLFFGIAGSETAAPDVAVMPSLVDESFAELREAASAKVVRVKAVRRSTAPANAA